MFNFTMHIFSERDWAIAPSSLRQIATHYPNSPITVIADGVNPPGIPDLCEELGARYVMGDRLKIQPNGGAWLERWLTLASQDEGEWLVRLDPDSWMQRPFKGAVPTSDIVGPKWENHDFVVSWIVSRGAAEQILNSEILRDSKYQDASYTYRPYLRPFEGEEGSAEAIVMCDGIMQDVAQRLELTWKAWREIKYQWRDEGEVVLGKEAIVHPYHA